MKYCFFFLFFLNCKKSNHINEKKEEEILNVKKQFNLQENIDYSNETSKPLNLVDLGDDDYILNISPEAYKTLKMNELSEDETSYYIDSLVDQLRNNEDNSDQELALTGFMSDFSSMLENLSSSLRRASKDRVSSTGSVPNPLNKKNLYEDGIVVQGQKIQFQGKIVLHNKRSMINKLKSTIKINKKVYDLKKINMDDPLESMIFVEKMVQDLRGCLAYFDVYFLS